MTRTDIRTDRGGDDPATTSATSSPEPGSGWWDNCLDWKLLLGVVGVLALLLTVSLLTGVYDIFGGEGGGQMFQITRIPRTIALVLSGAAMAMCGLVMQLLTQNRFVEPTTTGTTEWAGLGLMLTVIMWPDATILARMIGAIIAAFLGTHGVLPLPPSGLAEVLPHRPHRRHHARRRRRR
jgi:iron complex transport system permease protein